jgi:hypothetical protein
MKALTLYQPWATLIAIGVKKIETRSWSTEYRGSLAIHSSSKWQKEARLLLGRDPFFKVLYEAGYAYKEAHALGAIVAICELEACFPIHTGPLLLSAQEKAFGDYTPGRFMWMLDKVQKLEKPITVKGAQGLWNIQDFKIK